MNEFTRREFVGISAACLIPHVDRRRPPVRRLPPVVAKIEALPPAATVASRIAQIMGRTLVEHGYELPGAADDRLSRKATLGWLVRRTDEIDQVARNLARRAIKFAGSCPRVYFSPIEPSGAGVIWTTPFINVITAHVKWQTLGVFAEKDDDGVSCWCNIGVDNAH